MVSANVESEWLDMWNHVWGGLWDVVVVFQTLPPAAVATPQTDIHRFQHGQRPRRGGQGEHGEILGQSLKDVKYARVPL